MVQGVAGGWKTANRKHQGLGVLNEGRLGCSGIPWEMVEDEEPHQISGEGFSLRQNFIRKSTGEPRGRFSGPSEGSVLLWRLP